MKFSPHLVSHKNFKIKNIIAQFSIKLLAFKTVRTSQIIILLYTGVHFPWGEGRGGGGGGVGVYQEVIFHHIPDIDWRSIVVCDKSYLPFVFLCKHC